MKYNRVKISSENAMTRPTIRHADKDNIYVYEALIPWDYTSSTVVFFVSGKNGVEFGQFPTLNLAMVRFNEVTNE